MRLGFSRLRSIRPACSDKQGGSVGGRAAGSAEASMDGIGQVPEVRELGASWDHLESMSIEDLASLVVEHATSEVVPVAA